MKKKNLFLLLSFVLLISLACGLFNPELLGTENPDSAEASPEPIPTETTQEEEPVPAAQGENPCNNVFYPLIPTQQMIYKSTSSEGTSQTGITVANVEGNFATVDMLNIDTGITTQSTVECENKAIKNYPDATMGSLFDNMLDGTLNMEYISGYIAPSEKTLEANNWGMDWTSEYVMDGEITVESEGESMTVLIENSPVVMNWEIVETGQSLTVEAGAYNNVIEVARELNMDIKLDMGVMKMDSKLYIDSTHWFEPYVGMVKMEITEVSVEAQGMSFPIALDETMELVEFRPAE